MTPRLPHPARPAVVVAPARWGTPEAPGPHGGPGLPAAFAALPPAGGARSLGRAVAAVFDAHGDVLAAPGAADAWIARRRGTRAIAEATRALAVPEREHDALLRRLLGAALVLDDAVAAVLWSGMPVPSPVAAVPAALAYITLDGRPARLVLPRWRPVGDAAEELDRALRAAAAVVAPRPPVPRCGPA
jgi:hypothetical protein